MKTSFVLLLATVFISTVLILSLPISIAFSEDARGETISKARVAQTGTSTWDSGVIGSGEVRPNRYVQVRSAVPGRVEKIYVEPGEDVARGQALFLIASGTSRARVTRYSPLTGIAADIPVRTGELTTGETSSRPLMTIADMSRIYVDIYLDRPDFSKVIVNQPARIIIDAFHEAPIIGRVIWKDPKPVALSDAPADAPEFRVRVQITQVSNAIRRRIRPGMSATASIQVASKSLCKRQPIEDLVKSLAESFANKTMGTLDADRPYVGRFRILIEHSLAEDNDPQRFESRTFRSLAQAESWLKRREHDGLPNRATKPLLKCAKGVCSYDFDSGILHNTLFLKQITYGVRNGCPYIKTIYLLDGD